MYAMSIRIAMSGWVKYSKSPYPKHKMIWHCCSLQALISSLGWTYLDVRSALESQEVGRVKVSVNVPFVNCTKKWDSKQGKKVVQKQENADFVKMVSKQRHAVP